jgi:hypothetical protein
VGVTVRESSLVSRQTEAALQYPRIARVDPRAI